MSLVKGEGDHLLDLYFKDIGRYPLLSDFETTELLAIVHNADASEQARLAARNKLVQHNLRLVVKIAKQHQKQGLLLSDLISEGVFGLVRAIEKFDSGNGAKFSTYAYPWINQKIMRAISNTGRIIRVPVARQHEQNQLSKAILQLRLSLGRLPQPGEIAAAMNKPIEWVDDRLQCNWHLQSLDAPTQTPKDEKGDSLGDRLGAELCGSESPLDWAIAEEMRDCAAHFLGQLSERERAVLELRFGMGTEEPLSFRQMATHLGISGGRARQIYEKAVRKLKSFASSAPAPLVSHIKEGVGEVMASKPSGRPTKSDVRKKLEAALVLLRQKGSPFTMAQLADAAGVAATRMYDFPELRFAAKEAIAAVKGSAQTPTAATPSGDGGYTARLEAEIARLGAEKALLEQKLQSNQQPLILKLRGEVEHWESRLLEHRREQAEIEGSIANAIAKIELLQDLIEGEQQRLESGESGLRSDLNGHRLEAVEVR